MQAKLTVKMDKDIKAVIADVIPFLMQLSNQLCRRLHFGKTRNAG